MKYISKIILWITFVFISLSGLAQESITHHFMRLNPYRQTVNPASFTPYKAYIGIPGIASLSVGVHNSAFRYRNLFRTDRNGYPVAITPETFVNHLRPKNNWLNVTLNEEILGFGFRAKRLFFTFSYRIKMEEHFRFSKDLFAFPVKGNMSYLGQGNPADIDLNLSLKAYQEFSIGIQAQVNDRLSIGIRPKLLMGLAYVKSNELNARIYTDPESYAMTLHYKADIDAGLAIPIKIRDGGESIELDFDNFRISDAFRNMGFALDLGATYRFNDHLGIGLSVSDLGFISWKTPGIKIESQVADEGQFYRDGGFFFNGLTANQIETLIQDDGYLKDFGDTLLSYFPVHINETENTTISMLNAKIAAEVYYQINPKHRFTAYFQGNIIGKTFFPRLTLAYNANLVGVFDLCAHYTVMPGSYGNLGLGVGFNLWPIYLYFATDNIFSAVNPLSGRNVNAQVGLVVKWGKVRENILQPTGV